MELDQCISKRHSIKSYLDKQVSWDLISQLIDAAHNAPSSGNIQNWVFIVVTDDEKRRDLTKASLNQSWMTEAPIHIVVCSDNFKIKKHYENSSDRYIHENCAAAIQNLLLKATDLGLGTCWVGSFNPEMVDWKKTKVFAIGAYEAHVINVTATIENALNVPIEPVAFGTVFPQEQIDKFIKIGLSASFQNEITADEVSYMIRQKPKCGQVVAGTQPVVYSAFAQSSEDAGGNFICPEGFVKLPTLCPYLSKIDVDTLDQNDDPGISAFHGSINNWNASTTINTQVNGMLSKSTQDLEDAWKIDLKVPCFKDECAQDWNNFVTHF